MDNSQVEKYLDEGLEGKFFEGLPALDYLNKDFSDEELEKLSKQELINIITKAVVLVCIGERELNIEYKQVNDQLKETKVLLKQINAHYEIYPSLINVGESDLHFQHAKNKAELEKIYIKSLFELVRKLPEIKAKAKSTIPSSGGDARTENDIRTTAIKMIKDEEYPKVIHFMHLYGRVTFYAREWLDKYSDHGLVSEAYLRKIITDLNNKNNIKLGQKFNPKINLDA